MSSVGTSVPNSLQPSTQSSKGRAENGKIRVIVKDYEFVIGKYVKVLNTRTGHWGVCEGSCPH